MTCFVSATPGISAKCQLKSLESTINYLFIGNNIILRTNLRTSNTEQIDFFTPFWSNKIIDFIF